MFHDIAADEAAAITLARIFDFTGWTLLLLVC